MKEVDYIIVGQGLAGTVLAHTLIEAKQSVVIIDDAKQQKASQIAAGLYNPIVFKRLVKSWKVDELLPCMDTFYKRMEELLNEELYFKKNIVRLFGEEQEKTLWLKKCNEEVGKYLNPSIVESFMEKEVYNVCGASETIGAGNLKIELFINASQSYFLKNELLLQESFDDNQLHIEPDRVTYKSINAKKIIFCEGYKGTQNKYFSWLPFKLTKGEVLTIHAPELKQLDKVINKGVFILPIGNDQYKVGATYEWQELNTEITEKGKQELIGKLDKIIKVSYTIINHQAGIRPTVNDRRPFVGLHPEHKSIGILNGLGTKGVMNAPYCAQQLTDFLINDKKIDAEIDILRLKKALRSSGFRY